MGCGSSSSSRPVSSNSSKFQESSGSFLAPAEETAPTNFQESVGSVQDPAAETASNRDGWIRWDLPSFSNEQSSGKWVEAGFFVMPCMIGEMEVRFTWKDQGWGNQRGRIDLRLRRGSETVADQPVSETESPHEWQRSTVRFSSDAPIVAKARRGDVLMMRYVVGGGGGHELHVKDIVTNMKERTSNEEVSGDYPDVHWTPPDIESRNASDAFVDHGFYDLTARLGLLRIRFVWHDQGWGNQKGAVDLRLMRGDQEISKHAMSREAAPHKPQTINHALGADDPIVMDAEPGDRLCLSYRVGGGGGHALFVKNIVVSATTLPPISRDEIVAALTEALQGNLVQRKRALFQLARSGMSDIDEAGAVLESIRSEMQLPETWDMGRMKAIRMGDKPTYEVQEDDQINIMAIVPLVAVDEFQTLFDKSFRRKYTRDRKGGKVPQRLVVRRVARIQNAHTWQDYMVRQNSIRTESTPGEYSIENLKTEGVLEHLLTAADKATNTAWLFHGTSTEGAVGIATHDFRVDMAGSNAGTLYGNGVYLAESCAKSDEYADDDSEGLRRILICRTTLGNVLYSDEKRPDVDTLVKQCVEGSYNSVLGDREKIHDTFRELIVYDEDQVYPEFIVEYQREY
eukprot:TRINITY_DN106501_c0_g1_i1.p1 TRINITY_DN106501_c0_g1~~TRINITY_DN106501_c0_g1_i1.p1  ORF type:complete len:627 (+),score=59.98 TRINITY_DN106501_c0_g1_i1:43-1923(+)